MSGEKEHKGKEVYNIGDKFSKEYMLPMGKELKQAIGEHEQHHYPESPLDSKTVPYSVMDDKHIGRR